MKALWKFKLAALTPLLCLVLFLGCSKAALAIEKGKATSGPARPYNTHDLSFVHRWLQPGQFLPVSAIKPGMTGYGLTVFHGTKIEKFNVTVLGVIKKVLNGRDAIIARLSGGEMASNNVMKGASGSPVYINGKLVGAVSFGFEFSKEPIAGITPIVDMLDALAPGEASPGPIARWTPGVTLDPEMAKVVSAGGAAPRMVPLISPIGLVGFSPRAEAFLAERFKPLGLAVSSGASGAPDPSLTGGASALKPGSALSVMLATGDFTTTTTGTTTARLGGKVLAFGHPFLQAGAVDFPMANAYVIKVLPSLAVSFKMSSPGAVIGSVTADRPWSVGGQIGRSAKMIPATYTVTDETRNVKRVFHCQVIDHPELTPDLLAATTMSAIDATHQSNKPYIAHVKSLIEADGIEPILRSDCFGFNTGKAGSGLFRFFMPDPAAGYVLRTTADITKNEFQKSSIKNVKLDIRLRDGNETAEITRIFLDKPVVAPGETVTVNCVLRPYDGEERVESLTLELPRDLPDGNLLLGVSGGEEASTIKRRMGINDPQPESLKQIVEKIRKQGQGDELTLIAALPEQSVLYKGFKLINPPAHWSKLFFSNRHTRGASLVKGDLQTVKDVDRLVEGTHMITVEVRSPDKAQSRQAPYTIPPQGTDTGIVTTDQAKKTLDSSKKSQSQSSTTTVSSDSPSSTPETPASDAEKTSTAQPAKSGASSLIGSKDYPHIRPVRVWKQDSEEDLRPGKMESSTIDSLGRLAPGFQRLVERTLPKNMIIWSSVWSKGYFWFATADQIWKWAGGSEAPEAVAKLEAVAIPAMTADSKGIVYAAGAPNGQLYSIASDGAPVSIFKAPDGAMIASLCVDDQDNIYIGTTGKGRVYKLDQSRQSSLFFSCPQAHVTSLFYSLPDRKLYVGTGERGAVYAVDHTGKSEAVFQSAEHLVTGAVKDGKGDLYIATAGQGKIIRVMPSGETQTVALSEAFYRLHYDASTDSVFSGDAEGDITWLQTDPLTRQVYFVPVCHTEQEAVAALASDDSKHLFAGTSNLAVLRTFGMQPSASAYYESIMRDAGRPARWSRLRVAGAWQEGGAALARMLKIETRSGDVSSPDATWSSWQEAPFVDDAFVIASPQARYLQYKVSWKPEVATRTTGLPAAIGRIEVSYLPKNILPRFSTISMKAGAALAGKQDVSITGIDDDGDNMLLTVESSTDGGKTWKIEASDLRAKKSGPSSGSGASRGSSKAKNGDEKSGEREEGSAGSPADGSESKDKEDGKPEEQKDKETNKSPASVLSRVKGMLRLSDEDDDEKSVTGTVIGRSTTSQAKKKGDRKSAVSTSSTSTASMVTDNVPTSEMFSWAWDTTKVNDGNYMVRFTLDDRLSSPRDFAQAYAVRSVTIDNTGPEIALITSNQADGTLQFEVAITDELTPIANATYKIDDGDAFALAPVDGAADGLRVRLGAKGIKSEHGSHKVEIKATDRAGNDSIKTFTIK